MSSNAKPASEKALAAYFHDVGTVSVPTPGEELAVFRKLLAIEARMVMEFLRIPGAEGRLRKAAVDEEAVLPPKLLEGPSAVKEKVLAFVRMTDQGRTWFQRCLNEALHPEASDDLDALAVKNKRVAGLNAERDEVKNAFVAANLRLTVMVAKRYSRHCRHQSIADLIQEGNIGLMRAVDRFDPDRGFKFATYAVWWIRHHVKRAVSDKETPIRIPVHVSDLASKLSRLDGGHMAETGHGMDAEQMAKAAKVSAEKVQAVLSSRLRVLYLDAPTGEEENHSLLDTICSSTFPDPLSQLFSERIREELLAHLSGLTPFESRIVRHRYGIDDPKQLTLQEIASRYDLSRERIRQIEEKALEKLRRRMAGRSMGEYLMEAG